MAEECWESGRAAIYAETYDLVVWNEINYTISYKMLDAEKVVAALTGAGAGARDLHWPKRASKAVEAPGPGDGMKEVETPIHEGRILAQRGIDY